MKFQNPSLNCFERTDGHKHRQTDNPKPICSLLSQSWGHKKNFFFRFSPIDLLIILYQLTKFEAPSCYSFRDIMITKLVFEIS